MQNHPRTLERDTGRTWKMNTNNMNADEMRDERMLSQRMAQIKHKILVLSGKGGVGKSTVATNLAVALSEHGNKVGILDVDIHGPSVPKMLGVEKQSVQPGTLPNLIDPITVKSNLVAMSIGFLLADQDDAVIWRGPRKYAVIKQFLKDVEWGDLDYLVVDLPPGTGDEPLSIAQMIDDADGAVVVTTPQEVALADVRKSIYFCKKLNVPILGVIENMSGFTCPACGEVTDVFKRGGAKKMCRVMNLPFAGRIPLSSAIVDAGDNGSITDPDSNLRILFEPVVKALGFDV